MIIVTEVVKTMHSNRMLRTSILSIILLLSLLLPLLVAIPTVSADSISGEATFYFKDALSYDFEAESDFGVISVSQEIPTKKDDSTYPPRPIKINSSKAIFKREISTEEMFYWLAAWTFFILPEFEENISDEFGDLFEGFEIFLPHPYRIVEIFEYDGNETYEINGNVVFDLYFSSNPRVLPKYDDEVKVGLYTLGALFPREIKNTTVKIKRGPILSKGMVNQEVILDNVSLKLDPGKSLLFTIEIIQSDKARIIGSFVKGLINEKRLLNRWMKWGNFFENRSRVKSLQEVGSIIKEFVPLIQEFNFTIEDIAKFFDTFRSSSLVYDSVSHPSSVTMDFQLAGEGENTKLYFLQSENQMGINEPTAGKSQSEKISNTPIKWNGPELDERNKIIKKVSVDLYLKYFNLLNPGRAQVSVTLLDGDTEITSPIVKSLDRSAIFAQNPTTFIFDDVDYELLYGRSLSIEVSLANDSNTGFRKVSLLYASEDKPSSVKVIFTETDNIQFESTSDPENKLIVPGGSVKYTLNVTSEYEDDLYVNILEDKVGEWKVSIVEDQPIEVNAKGTAKLHIYINSTENIKKAYGDSIDLTFIVSGMTGIDREVTSVEISEDAIKYDVDIVEYTKSKNIKYGKSGTFYFIVKNNNTGAVDDVDSYSITATSENNWKIRYTDSIDNLEVNGKTGANEILLVVDVPENTSLETDVISFTVTSDSNNKAFAIKNVTVNVIGPTIFESIYNFFESTSDSLGLDEIFGASAPTALASILVAIILFIIVILTYFITRKVVKIICTERIKEIDTDGEAKYQITIKNPTRKTRTYELSSPNNPSSQKWEKSLDLAKISIEGHQSKTISLLVKPTEDADPNDWTEAKLKVKVLGKKKSEEISTMTLLKDGKTLLKISDVFTWPKDFKEGNRVTTSFKLMNKGNITARNVNVKLYINGKEKNKTVVTIPSEGYADIRMPWIAYKGKNKLYIKAKEH